MFGRAHGDIPPTSRLQPVYDWESHDFVLLDVPEIVQTGGGRVRVQDVRTVEDGIEAIRSGSVYSLGGLGGEADDVIIREALETTFSDEAIAAMSPAQIERNFIDVMQDEVDHAKTVLKGSLDADGNLRLATEAHPGWADGDADFTVDGPRVIDIDAQSPEATEDMARALMNIEGMDPTIHVVDPTGETLGTLEEVATGRWLEAPVEPTDVQRLADEALATKHKLAEPPFIDTPAGRITAGRAPTELVDDVTGGDAFEAFLLSAETAGAPIHDPLVSRMEVPVVRGVMYEGKWHFAYGSVDDGVTHDAITDALGIPWSQAQAYFTNEGEGALIEIARSMAPEQVMGQLVAEGFDPNARFTYAVGGVDTYTDLITLMGDDVAFMEQIRSQAPDLTQARERAALNVEKYKIRITDPTTGRKNPRFAKAMSSTGESYVVVIDRTDGAVAWSSKTDTHYWLQQGLAAGSLLGEATEDGVPRFVKLIRQKNGLTMLPALDWDDAQKAFKYLEEAGFPLDSPIKLLCPDYPGAVEVGPLQMFLQGPIDTEWNVAAVSIQEEAQRIQYANMRQEASDAYTRALTSFAEWDQSVMQSIDDGIGELTITMQERQARQGYFQGVERMMQEELENSTYDAAQRVHEILFDYASRSNPEQILRTYSPFTTWQLRNPAFWAQQFAEKPNLIMMLYRAWVVTEKERQKRNLTARFKGTVGFETPEGGYLGIDVRPSVSIFGQFQEPWEPIGTTDPDSVVLKFLRDMIQAGQWIGVRPYPWIEYAFQQAGVLPQTDLMRGILGPVQRVLETYLHQQGILPPWKSIFGTSDPGTRSLYEYYIHRRLVELEEEGVLTHEQVNEAFDNPEDPNYQSAMQEVIEIQSRFGYASLAVPTGVKYATPGEVGIRELLAEQAELEGFDRAAFREEHPELIDYSRLFQTPEERAAAFEREELFEAIGERGVPTVELPVGERERIATSRAELFERLEEVTGERVGPTWSLMQRPGQMLSYAYNRQPEDEQQAYQLLNAIEPKPVDFEDEAGEVIWDEYENAVDAFREHIIPALSTQWGIEMDVARFEQWENRLRDPIQVAFDLNQERRNEGFRMLETYQVDGENFAQAMTSFVEDQYYSDILFGMDPEAASQRAIETFEHVMVNGLPFEYEQELLGDYVGEIPAEDIAAQVSQRLPAWDMADIRQNLEGRVLPGMFDADTREEAARSGLIDYYYQLMPNERDQVEQMFEMEEGQRFVDFVDTLDVDEVIAVSQDLPLATQGPAYFVANVSRLTSGVVDTVLPPNDLMTEREKLDLAQVQRDWFLYNYEQEFEDRPGEWTPLMEEYYGGRGDSRSEFWDVLGQYALKSAAFDDPIMGAFLSAVARTGLDFSDAQYKLATEWFLENQDRLVDEELTAMMREHPDWVEFAAESRTALRENKSLSMEDLKNQYYLEEWRRPSRGVPSPREEWERENVDDWKELNRYLGEQKAYQLAHPFYQYFFYQRDYVKWHGDALPDDQAVQARAVRLSNMWLQAYEDLDMYAAGLGEWTYALEVFIGPDPNAILATQATRPPEEFPGGEPSDLPPIPKPPEMPQPPG
jgi:hypothetical protein